MEKIKTKEEIEARDKRKKIILSVFILGLLVFSTLGYALLYSPSQSGQEKSDGNSKNNQDNQNSGIEYVNGRYVLDFNGNKFSFVYSPELAAEVPVNVALNANSYNNKIVFIASNDSLINSEIASVLGSFSERMQQACYGKCEANLPEKNCTDYLIVLNSDVFNSSVFNSTDSDSGDLGKVYQQDNCVFIEGDLLTADAFLYKILGVN